ncbi:MAG: hypothetical protein HRT44_09600 [Bdellovibrionales bacterium]|nr:hypothetical protein [Bdellovibrionales bacterium]
MDAGPNVHLLWRENQQELALKYFRDSLESRMTCLTNIPEIGFAKL